MLNIDELALQALYALVKTFANDIYVKLQVP